MDDRQVRCESKHGTGPDGDVTLPCLMSTLRGARHTRCDALVASPCCVTVLRYHASQMMFVASDAQVSSIVRVAAPVAAAVARTWGLF